MIAAAVTTLGAVGALGMQTVNAATDPSTNPASGLVQKIADKFNLNQADVQSVFDAQRTEMEAARQQEMKDELAAAVSAGKLTQDQADKVTAKLAELKANRDSLKDKTPQERRDAIKAARDALQQWATDNNIPSEYLKFGGHGNHDGESADS